MKRVFSSFNQTAVYHARNLLENAGIETLVKNAVLSSAMGELPPAECQAELWVVVQHADRASRILRFEQAGGTPWRCPACGETQEPQFTQCWRCNAYRT